MKQLLLVLVLCGCEKKKEQSIYEPEAVLNERITVAFSDNDSEAAGMMRIPLSSDGTATNYPPTTYFHDGAGDIWDAKWIKR